MRVFAAAEGRCARNKGGPDAENSALEEGAERGVRSCKIPPAAVHRLTRSSALPETSAAGTPNVTCAEGSPHSFLPGPPSQGTPHCPPAPKTCVRRGAETGWPPEGPGARTLCHSRAEPCHRCPGARHPLSHQIPGAETGVFAERESFSTPPPTTVGRTGGHLEPEGDMRPASSAQSGEGGAPSLSGRWPWAGHRAGHFLVGRFP